MSTGLVVNASRPLGIEHQVPGSPPLNGPHLQVRAGITGGDLSLFPLHANGLMGDLSELTQPSRVRGHGVDQRRERTQRSKRLRAWFMDTVALRAGASC